MVNYEFQLQKKSYMQPVQPVEPNQPNQPDQPVQPVEPDQPVQPVKNDFQFSCHLCRVIVEIVDEKFKENSKFVGC